MNQLKFKYVISALLAFMAMAVYQLKAQVLYSDNFSSYSLGALDANDSGGPNQAPNGGPGNPWWGPGPPNLAVATSFNGINPYPGDTHLVDGQSANFFAEQFNNIGYRLNGGNNFLGGVALSWAFYDPVGAGSSASGYNDIAYLDGFQSADGYTSTKDYTGSGPDLQSSYTSGDELLGLGADNPSGGNSGFYQARVIGSSTADDGATYTGANGWYNLSVARTVGWHTASIVLGAPNGANTTVTMYIDGHDVLDETVGAGTVGVNTIAVDSGWGSQVGAFDNFVVSVPEPGACALIGFGLLSLVALKKSGNIAAK